MLRQEPPTPSGCVNLSMVVFSPQEAVTDALQSLAIESLDPGPEARKLADSYARGCIRIEDLFVALDELDRQERLGS